MFRVCYAIGEPNTTKDNSQGVASNIQGDRLLSAALRKNYVFLTETLRCDKLLLGTLFQEYVISARQFTKLREDKLDHKEKIHQLIVYVLPKKRPQMFWKFCKILRHLKQTYVADKLLQTVSDYESTLQGDCVKRLAVNVLFCNKKVLL